MRHILKLICVFAVADCCLLPGTGFASPAQKPSFDGEWSVTSSGPCIVAGTAQVTISGGRIISPVGNGSVSPSGAVTTLSSFNGMTIVGKGRIVGRTGTGSYRQSDGCAGTWSAYKL